VCIRCACQRNRGSGFDVNRVGRQSQSFCGRGASLLQIFKLCLKLSRIRGDVGGEFFPVSLYRERTSATKGGL
jgi:hypothetical protein